MGCLEVALKPDTSADTRKEVLVAPSVFPDGDLDMADGTKDVEKKQVDGLAEESASQQELLFRCFTCKRLSHYRHLPVPDDYKDEDAVDSVMLAEYYQSTTEWLCGDCSSYTWELDKILAWRPYPSTGVEPTRAANESLNHKSPLPREYLVKWLDRSYRRTQWVPHMWLVTTHGAKLKNFLNGGAKVQLLEEPLPEEDEIEADSEPKKVANEGSAVTIPFDVDAKADQDVSVDDSKALALPSGAMPDAQRRIPLAWKTVDRVLDVLLWRPAKREEFGKKKAQGKRKGKKGVVASEEEDDDDDDDNAENDLANAEFESAFVDGEQPSGHLTETVREWEKRTSQNITTEQIKNVVWAFIKWDDLPYDEGKFRLNPP